MSKKSINFKKLYLLVMFVLCCTISYSETLKIAKVEGNIHQELASKLLEEIYQRLDVPVEFVELPGERALVLSSEGVVDGEVIRIFELEDMYPTLVRVPTPFSYADTVVFSKNHNFEVSGWSSLKDYKVGISRGMKYYEIKLQGAKHIEKVNDNIILMQMLNLDRVDIVVTTGLNGIDQINKMGITSIKALSPYLERVPLYHYLHEKHKDLVPKVDQIIKSMLESGELETLREEIIKELLE